MDDKLKACPFCGGDAMISRRPLSFNRMFDDDGEKAYHIACSKCWVRTIESMDKESVIKDWNRRTPNE